MKRYPAWWRWLHRQRMLLQAAVCTSGLRLCVTCRYERDHPEIFGGLGWPLRFRVIGRTR